MEYKLEHPALTGDEVILRISGIFGNPELYQNGEKLFEKSLGTNIYIIRSEEGPVTIALEPKKLDPFPRLEIAGEKYPIGRKLSFFDYIIVGLPMTLLLIGGVIGALLGFLATSFNARIMRMPKSAFERYGFCLASFLAAFVVWYFLAIGINSIIS